MGQQSADGKNCFVSRLGVEEAALPPFPANFAMAVAPPFICGTARRGKLEPGSMIRAASSCGQGGKAEADGEADEEEEEEEEVCLGVPHKRLIHTVPWM